MLQANFTIPENQSEELIQMIQNLGGSVRRERRSKLLKFRVNFRHLAQGRSAQKSHNTKSGVKNPKMSMASRERLFANISKLKKMAQQGKFDNYKFTYNDFLAS